jgi:hypothetical protein
MNEVYEVVERPPTAPDNAKGGGLLGAVRETATTGKALRVARDRNKYLQGNFRRLLKLEGLRVRTKGDGEHVIVWAEPITNRNGTGA